MGDGRRTVNREPVDHGKWTVDRGPWNSRPLTVEEGGCRMQDGGVMVDG